MLSVCQGRDLRGVVPVITWEREGLEEEGQKPGFQPLLHPCLAYLG